MLDSPTLDDTSMILVTSIFPYPPLYQFQSFMLLPCILTTPFAVSTCSQVINLSSSATMIEAVLKVEPGSIKLLTAIFRIS